MIITIIIVAVKQAGLQKILRIHASGVTDRKGRFWKIDRVRDYIRYAPYVALL